MSLHGQLLELQNYRFHWLPFRFERISEEEIFVSNYVGEWIVLKNNEFEQLFELRFRGADFVRRLLARHIIAEDSSAVAQRLLALKLATRMRGITELTGLHIFVVTLRCEHACEYCQVSRKNSGSTKYDMSWDDALKALDIVFQSPARDLKIEFQGGEPLLNFPLIKHIVLEAKKRGDIEGRRITFVIASNLVPIDDEILEFARVHSIVFSTSLDGPAELHNSNRRRPGRNSYELAVRGINRIREHLGHDSVSALMTTTERSLQQPEAIIDEYVKLGFREIFLRFLSPYGHAVSSNAIDRYGSEQWLKFYHRGLRYIIELNRSGTEMREVFASIYLKKLLVNDVGGYVDLVTPTGAGLSALVYNYDSDVYASDESRMLREMGDDSFRLGSVRTHTYRDLILSDTLLNAVEESFSSSSPMCSDCAFEPYCGSDPVLHYATQGDMKGFKPASQLCERTMTIVPLLIDLYRSDEFCRDLFRRWATP